MFEEIQIKPISVTEPVGKAIQRTKAILFSPFDLGKWFTIGFCAWLATLGEGGFNFNGGGNHGGSPNIDNVRSNIGHYIEANLYWIIPVGLVVLALVVAIILVLSWLRCRGKFMFLYCVAHNRAEVAIPWKEYAAEGNSLFIFKIVFGLISLVCFVPLIIGWVAAVGPLLRSERLIIASIGVIAVLSLLTIALAAALLFVAKFTDYFVVPTMYLNRIRCLEAWKQFWELLKPNIGRFIVFALFLLVLNLAVGTLVILAVFATCGCACCFLMIPFIGTVVMLPIIVFMRSYSAYYLAQYGRQWDVFAPSVSAVAVVDMPPANPDPFFRGQ